MESKVRCAQCGYPKDTPGPHRCTPMNKTPREQIEEAAIACRCDYSQNIYQLVCAEPVFLRGALFGARLGFEAGWIARIDYERNEHSGYPTKFEEAAQDFIREIEGGE